MLVPLALYFLIAMPCGFDAVGGENAPTVWLGFWGGYMGAMISAAVAFFILRKQLEQNHEENEKNRQLQINVIKYEQQQKELLNLKLALMNYIQSFKMSEIILVIKNIQAKNYSDMDMVALLDFERTLEYNRFMLNTEISEINLDELFKICEPLEILYKLLINDIIVLITMMQYIPRNSDDVDRYIGARICEWEFNTKVGKEKLKEYSIVPPISVFEKMKNIKDCEVLEENMEEITRCGFRATQSAIYELKEMLISEIQRLINTQQQEIEEKLAV